jgi:O-antigen ligase
VKDVFFYTTIGASIVGFIGLFEALNGWQTYSTVPINWNSDASLMNYLQRDGILRGIGSTGHAIILGYISVLSIGMWMQPKSINKINLKMYFLLAGIICGMISSFSRGSWLGAVALIISYYTVKNRIALFGATKPIGIIILLFIIIAQTPYWNKIESLLPFIGTVDASNLTYRQKLLEYSLQIILDSPFFGNPYFIAYLEDLRQGQGIIDIVNSYLAIALRSGIIGLGIFLACFIFAIIALYKNIKANNDRKNESAKTIAIIFAILVMIASTSSIGIVPVVFWMVLGISSQLTSYNNKISN